MLCYLNPCMQLQMLQILSLLSDCHSRGSKNSLSNHLRIQSQYLRLKAHNSSRRHAVLRRSAKEFAFHAESLDICVQPANSDKQIAESAASRDTSHPHVVHLGVRLTVRRSRILGLKGKPKVPFYQSGSQHLAFNCGLRSFRSETSKLACV